MTNTTSTCLYDKMLAYVRASGRTRKGPYEFCKERGLSRSTTEHLLRKFFSGSYGYPKLEERPGLRHYADPLWHTTPVSRAWATVRAHVRGHETWLPPESWLRPRIVRLAIELRRGGGPTVRELDRLMDRSFRRYLDAW